MKDSINTKNSVSQTDSPNTSDNYQVSQEIPEHDKNKNTRTRNYQFESNRQYFSICIYALFVILIGTMVVYCIMNMDKTKTALSHFTQALSPFLIAFFIAYILNPIVVKLKTFFEKVCKITSQKVTKALSIVLTYLIVLGIVTITLVYIIPELGKSLSDLSVKFQIIGTQLIEFLQHIEDLYPNLGLSAFEEKLSDLTMQLVSLGPNMVKDLIPAILSFSMGIVRLAINVLLSIVISIYMLNDKKMINKNITRALYAFWKKDKVDGFIENAKECNSIFSSFIIGKSLDSLIIGILCFILMTILKLPYSVLLSVIVGLTNMIPYFGPFIGAVPGVVLFLVIHPIKAIIFTIMIFALQQFDGLYLGPKILGNSTGLKPLWVIFAITLGGAYAGVLGMFLGVPVVAVIAFLFNKVITARLERKNIKVDEN